MRTNFPLVGVAFLLFGLIFGAVGGVLLRTEATRAEGFLSAQGTVTELEWSGDAARSVVAFSTAAGEARVVHGAVWSHPPAAEVGEHLPVRYSPTTQDAFIDDVWERWLLPGVFTSLGVIFFLVGVGVVALRRRALSAEAEKELARDLFAQAAQRPRPDDFNVFRVVGLIFTPIGLAALVGFGLWVRSDFKDREGFVPTRGTVVDFKRDAGGFSAAVVEFRDGAGQAHRFTSNVWARPPAYDAGDEVKVRYRASKPADAYLNGFVEVWLWPTVLFVFALVFGGLGGLLLYFSREDDQRPRVT